MTELTSTYSTEELGWVTDTVKLSCDIYLMVELKNTGYVVIKQLDEKENTYPKVLVSGRCRDIKVRIFAEDDSEIRILTSEEPNSIKYVNI